MSSATAGPLLALCVLLAGAGVGKVVRPMATVRALAAGGLPGSGAAARLLGVAEITIAVLAAVTGSRSAALVVAATYLGFAAFTLRLIARSDGQADCGCFGADEAAATNGHVALDLGAAALAGLAAAAPPGSLGTVLAHQPLAGGPFVALVGLCTWLGYVAYTVLPRLGEARTAGRDRNARTAR